jgi:phosphatidylserine/phosphatidylglycerophosphate/cardiolipin synthase-like enzyme
MFFVAELIRIQTAVIELAVSGKYWVGRKGGSVLTSIREITDIAQDEIQLTVYAFGKNTLGFLQILQTILARGIKIQIIINRFSRQPASIRKKLAELKKQFGYLTIFDFNPQNQNEDLHAKIIVIDRTWAVVGSPNVSWHGYISNHELALILKGEMVQTIAGMIDDLARSNDTKEVCFV